jgi:hypothetical protein
VDCHDIQVFVETWHVVRPAIHTDLLSITTCTQIGVGFSQDSFSRISCRLNELIDSCERVILSEDEIETSDHGRDHDSGDFL